MNRLTKTLLAACAIASCSACQSTGTPKATVDNYLKALSRDSATASQQYLCWKGDTKGLPIQLPTGIKKWEVMGEQEKTEEKDPDSRYKLISARIESTSVGGFSVTKTWDFQVWKSDEFYESSKRYYDKINQVLDQGSKVNDEANKLLGRSDSAPKPKLISPPDRAAISSNPYCVLVVKPAQ